jgi:hypothetical protein
VHAHGGFVNSNDLIKYPTDVSKKLESVSTFYLSDIGSILCAVPKDFKAFDGKFLESLRDEPLEKGISIKDISDIAQESLKGVRMKNPNQRDNRSIIENYFEPGVYNLAVSTEWTLTETGDAIRKPFLNKKYSCGTTRTAHTYMDILVVTDNGATPLRDIIGGTFYCQNEYSSITTFELVQELTKVIPDLKHVLIIDTSCSKFTPTIIEELFKEMPDDSTPHKHRKTGLFKEMSPFKDMSPSHVKRRKKTKKELQLEDREKLKTLKSDLEPYFKGLKGGKRTKKRHLHRYNKNKSIKRRH